MTDPAVREWVGWLPDKMRQVAGYHLGWLNALGQPVDAGAGGKAVRPALVYACHRAVGQTEDEAVPAAVAVELVHNFSLIHDDVIDRDEMRRHRPSVWAALGLPAALLGGDALLTLALRVLTSMPGHSSDRAVSVLAEATVALLEGQALDTAFEQRETVTVEEYRAVAAAKTGALMGAACALGAQSAGASTERAEHFSAFGSQLGVAFQIADDLLGLYGDQAATGKPMGSDIAARKKSYPIAAALGSGTDAGRELAELYASPTVLTPEQINRAADLVEQAGGVRSAQQGIAREVQGAFAALAEADPAPAAREELMVLTTLMTDRSH